MYAAVLLLLAAFCFTAQADEPSNSIADTNWFFTIDDAPTRAVLTNSRTFWYDERTLPRVNVDATGKVYPHGFDLSRGTDRRGTGAPNNEKPWLKPGGFDNVKNLHTRRAVLIPEGKRTVYRLMSRRVFGQQIKNWVSDYPIGTTFAEFMTTPEGYKALRRRTKTAANIWDAVEYEDGKHPKGMEAVANCSQCHQDIGKHAWEIDRNRTWYSFVGTASEPGGPMHFHPFSVEGVNEREAVWPKPNPLLIHLIRIEQP